VVLDFVLIELLPSGVLHRHLLRLLTAAFREKRAATAVSLELLWKKTFPAGDVRRASTQSAKKTGGPERGVNRTH
jgi:hypothetical protein